MAVGELYITVDGNTRIVHPSSQWLHAVANVLNDQGHQASHTVSACTIHFRRDADEEQRAMALLDEVVRVKGGLSIHDIQ